jgi:sugar phosphate isomerase/epimerase
MPDEAFEADVERISRHGLGGIGIWEYKIENHEISDVKAQLEAHRLRVANCIPVGNSVYPDRLNPTPTDPRVRVESLRRRIARLAPLAPESIVTVTGPMGEEGAERFWETCRWAYHLLAETARDEGVTLALEPIHPSSAADICAVSTIAETAAFLDELDEPLMGILVDSWHVGQDPDMREQLSRERERIAGAHVADHRPGAVHWSDRAFPGEGTGEAASVIAALDDVGFKGFLDVEIFSDDGRIVAPVEPCLWKLDPDELIERCVRLFVGETAGV